MIAALAAGESITEAARAAGVHRSTIHNWLKEGRQFRFEFDTIRQETVEFLRDQLAGSRIAGHLEMTGDYEAAIKHYRVAAGRATNTPERNYLLDASGPAQRQHNKRGPGGSAH